MRRQSAARDRWKHFYYIQCDVYEIEESFVHWNQARKALSTENEKPIRRNVYDQDRYSRH